MLQPNVNSSPIRTFTTTFISRYSFQGQNENLYSWDERNIFDTIQSLDLSLSLTKWDWNSIWMGCIFLVPYAYVNHDIHSQFSLHYHIPLLFTITWNQKFFFENVSLNDLESLTCLSSLFGLKFLLYIFFTSFLISSD